MVGCRGTGPAPAKTPGAGPVLAVAPETVAVGGTSRPVGGSERPERPLHRYEFERAEMGVPFRVVLYAWNPALAKVAAREALDRVRELNAVFSDYEFDSELSRLNQSAGTGRWVEVSETLWEVLCWSQELAARTEGAFDITVGPAVTLWRRARRIHAMPPPEVLRLAREAVGYQKLRLDPARRRAMLPRPRMKLDLGGVAKGVALDEAMKVLKRRGIRHALISGGGDLLVSEAPPGREAWRIELPPVEEADGPPGRYVRLRHSALATSGDLYQHVVIDGVRYSHIVDPRTCIGLTDQSLVTVIAPTGREADALATAISVLGPEKGLRLAAEREGVEVQILRRPEGRLEWHRSVGFTDWLAPMEEAAVGR